MIVDRSLLHQNPIIRGYFEVIKEKFSLTRREGEILQLLMLMGGSNREIGCSINISEKTVRNHVASIQSKLHVKSSRGIQAVVFRDTLLPVFLEALQTPHKATAVHDPVTSFH
ncbi:helix-turn-helix domain-containing protein [Paenibacillus ihuae]|uniref:helix-turn-helix domain-containing protein n=1 Tax=Paenibacillus ihuae TaxID=1232431 RepID=UPI0006D58686